MFASDSLEGIYHLNHYFFTGFRSPDRNPYTVCFILKASEFEYQLKEYQNLAGTIYHFVYIIMYLLLANNYSHLIVYLVLPPFFL